MTALLKYAPWILVLVAIGVALWFWKDKESVKVDLANATGQVTKLQDDHKRDVQIHVDDRDTIMKLTTYRDANEKIMSKFVADMLGIGAEFSKFNQSLNELRRTNVEVDKYLAEPVPLALRNLLNGVPNKTAVAPAANAKH